MPSLRSGTLGPPVEDHLRAPSPGPWSLRTGSRLKITEIAQVRP